MTKEFHVFVDCYRSLRFVSEHAIEIPKAFRGLSSRARRCVCWIRVCVDVLEHRRYMLFQARAPGLLD